MDTIAAIATPPGRGGVGIVRISGPDAARILRALVPAWPDTFESHKLRLSRIVDARGDVLDESLAVVMNGPNSYTGEDVVELQCHGGPVILRRVLDASLEAGARMAAPGEFTQRAFLNGRLDLTQAEAVADLIEANSESAHRLAMEHLQGRLGAAISRHLEGLVEAMVLIESAIDFSHEEHVYAIEYDAIRERLDAVAVDLRALIARFDQGRRQREGVRVVVAGPTNAGKSTLFNALYGDDRAIVTDIAGTTRDFLEEELLLQGVAVRLIDTAGLRATDDRVEAIGIERSREWASRADIVLWVIDRSAPLTQTLRAELAEASEQSRPQIIVLNKCDLDDALSAEDRALVGEFESVIETSLGAMAPQGQRALEELLGARALELTQGEGVLLSRARHLASVRGGLAAIDRALEAISMQVEHELLAIDVREAIDELGEIVGRVTTDDILNKIFGEFCIGK